MRQTSSRQRGHSLRPIAVLLAAAVVALLTAATADAAETDGYQRTSPAVVVANRGSGDISVIDTRTHSVVNLDLPGEAQPMYVNHDPRHDRVFVGDRNASQLIALDDETFDVIGTVDVGEGVFHQWVDSNRRQIWVVGDDSQTVTVVDTRDLDVEATINIPADVADRGGKPHDVFVKGAFAYVTILGLDDGDPETFGHDGTVGEVIQYSTRTFAELDRVTVGDDPHVFVQGPRLYVASQASAEVATFNARTMSPLDVASVSSAHGIFVTSRGEVLVTSIADGGTNAVNELSRDVSRVVDTVDTAVPIPHNLSVDTQRQVFITHSGPTADRVSITTMRQSGFEEPVIVTAGINPFGLAFVR